MGGPSLGTERKRTFAHLQWCAMPHRLVCESNVQRPTPHQCCISERMCGNCAGENVVSPITHHKRRRVEPSIAAGFVNRGRLFASWTRSRPPLTTLTQLPNQLLETQCVSRVHGGGAVSWDHRRAQRR